MKTAIICIGLMLIGNTIFCQKTLIKSIDDKNLVFNKIDTIDKHTWIVDYEFRDRIDTIKYVPSENKGYIISHKKNGEYIRKEEYYSKGLQAPYVATHSAQFWIKKEELLKEYFGLSLVFPHEYLTKVYKYYKYGSIKEYQAYRYGKTTCTMVFMDPETFEETIEKQECYDRIETGIWKWYDIYGNVIKEQNNN